VVVTVTFTFCNAVEFMNADVLPVKWCM